MSEHDFVSIGIPLGTSRLTISATTIGSMVGYLNDLNEVDETDPEGMSPINTVLDHVNTINAAVNIKMPGMALQPQASAPRPGGFNQPAAAPNAAAPAPAGQTCQHGAMTFRSGTSNATGKPYSGYFCPAPRGANQCKPVFN